MGALDQTKANNTIDALLGTAAFTAVPSVHVRLMTANGSATANGTELTGTGYTAGGTVITFAAAATGSASSNVTVSWTNSSGGSWSITGVEIWTTDATPKRIAWGALTTNPTSVPNGAQFQITSGNLTLQFP